MPGGKTYKNGCILCKGRPKPNERRPVNKQIKHVLQKNFCVDANTNDTICNKCRHKCRSVKQSKQSTSTQFSPQLNTGPSKQTLSSPPSVTLSFPTTTKSHAFCFVCKKPGPKLLTVSNNARLQVFVFKGVIVPTGARCCPRHVEDGKFTQEGLEAIPETYDEAFLNRSTIVSFMSGLRGLAEERETNGISFDDGTLGDDEYMTLTGITKDQFSDLMKDITNVNSTKTRSVRNCIGILLTKLRTGMSNQMLGVLFRMNKFQIRRAVKSAREALMSSFVPQNLGFSHISREEVINQHTRPLARELFSDITENPAILVLDGTYIYVQKSGNFSFSRRSYSMHKHRPLVKPMMVVSTTGYIVSVLGPYLADSKNSDANILKHMIMTNAEEIKKWVDDQDVFVVDRGFRDASELLSDLGIQMEMPAFLPRGNKQHTCAEANSSRLVTKIRWVVEAVNGRIKNWRYLDKTLPNSQIPFIRDYVCCVAALCNKYRPPLSSGDADDDQVLAAKMLHLSKLNNSLQERVENERLDRKTRSWKVMDSADIANSFPIYNEEELRQLTLGVYQIKMAKSYTHEHFDIDGKYETLINTDIEGLICAKIQSRHVSAKQYLCWIGHEDGIVTSWYCKCKGGSRVVGACAHVTSVIWYLSYARHNNNVKGVRNWTNCVEDAARIPDPIDESDDDDNGEDVFVEE